MDLSKLNNLISRDQLDDALKLLESLDTAGRFASDITQLKRRMTANDSDNRTGKITTEEYGRERSKISSAIQQIGRELEAEQEAGVELLDTEEPKKKTVKTPKKKVMVKEGDEIELSSKTKKMRQQIYLVSLVLGAGASALVAYKEVGEVKAQTILLMALMFVVFLLFATLVRNYRDGKKNMTFLLIVTAIFLFVFAYPQKIVEVTDVLFPEAEEVGESDSTIVKEDSAGVGEGTAKEVVEKTVREEDPPTEPKIATQIVKIVNAGYESVPNYEVVITIGQKRYKKLTNSSGEAIFEIDTSNVRFNKESSYKVNGEWNALFENEITQIK